MYKSFGQALRQTILKNEITSVVGIYDMFSASIAGKSCESLFVSGFGFAASYYGLPDIGFIAWPDMTNFVHRLRSALPHHHLLVDIDDGYGDPEIACHVVRQLEGLGASGVILEDQERPRKCGHFAGKKILELPVFLEKLNRVLATRHDLVVVARTDAVENADILKRVEAFAQTDADVILADGLKDIGLIKEIKAAVNGKPLLFNQIAGGKSPPVSLSELAAAGIKVVIYSTPCLFAAQEAIETMLQKLWKEDGRLPSAESSGNFVGVQECTAVLQNNLANASLGVPKKAFAEELLEVN